MDRQVSPERLKREKQRRYLIIAASAVLLFFGGWWLLSFMQGSISAASLRLGRVDKGEVQIATSASGEVVPAFEEIITSPVQARLIAVLKHAGDSVHRGEPLLELDLQSVRTEFEKLQDELRMKQTQLHRQEVQLRGELNAKRRELKVKAMQNDRRRAELQSERYLDSIGAGTTDKVREIELANRVAALEYEGMVENLRDREATAAAEQATARLEIEIFRKTLEEKRRQLDDARIASPRDGVLTFVLSEVGTLIGAGSQVATVSDPKHFRIQADIADDYAQRLSVGAKAVVNLDGRRIEGTVTNITPAAKNGVVRFYVGLSADETYALRSGLKVSVYVLTALRNECVRIPFGNYYHGEGLYEMYVRRGSTLVRREVRLGGSGESFVEVMSGLEPGEEVVLQTLDAAFRNSKKIKLKD